MLKIIIGVGLFVVTSIGTMITIVSMLATIVLAKRKTNHLYIIATMNMALDLVPLLVTLLYLAPSIIADSYLFPGGREDPAVVAIGTIYEFGWYGATLTQTMVAVNRLTEICCSKETFFNSSSVYKLFFFLFPIALFMAINSQYILPCCQFICDHAVLSYSYIEKPYSYNYASVYIDFPLDLICTTIIIVCYTIIFTYVRKSHTRVSHGEVQKQQQRRRETALAIQFVYISASYIFSWLFFRVFLLATGNEKFNFYAFETLCTTICFSANGVVYLFRNTEVKRVVRSALANSSSESRT